MENTEEKIEKDLILKGGTEAIEVTYPNGHRVLKVKLSDGREATIRELLAEDSEKAARLANGNSELAAIALASVATTIDGIPVLIEDMRKIKMKDYARISDANSELNF